jgi:hypothetical protein
MNIDYSIHRYGEWVMLMLGESILSLLIVDVSQGVHYYWTFLSGVVSIILLQYLHFRSQPEDADEHAMRRSRPAGVCFTYLMYAYSMALIILGTSYKMFLFEFLYKEEDDNDKRRMLLFPLFQRFLAGGDSAALRFSTDERLQRIAYFFCGSMAVVWFCLDGMTLTHGGYEKKKKHCECDGVWWTKPVGALLVLIHVCLIGFMASFCLYETRPEILSFVGLCCILVQLTLRAVGSFLFPNDEEIERREMERMIHYTAARMTDNRSHEMQVNSQRDLSSR